MPNPAPSEEIQEYLRLYELGWTFKQIGEKFWLSSNSIRHALVSRGLTNPNTRVQVAARVRQICQMYANGVSGYAIAKRLGVTFPCVYKHLKQQGIEIRTKSSFHNQNN